MSDVNNEKLNTGEAGTVKNKIFAFLDNFWYHYKWHSLIALFLIFAITICTFQMCTKTSYDAYIVYAGNYEINRKSENGDIPEYETLTKMFERVAANDDEDRDIKVALKDLLVLTDKEITDAENKDSSVEVNYSLIAENREILKETMLYSNFYLVLMSPSVYEANKVVDDVYLFENIKNLGLANDTTEFYDDYAVKLSSTEFYTLPAVCNLPEDTIVALRSISAYANRVNKKQSESSYNMAKEILSEIIQYEK